MLTLYTPATGFPDLEVKIAYGLARVGIEAFGINRVKIIPEKGFYLVLIDGNIPKLNDTFHKISARVLSSDFIPRSTPGITGRTADTIKVSKNETFDLSIYTHIIEIAEHKKSENFCRHKEKIKVSNVIGFTAAATTGVLCKRDGLDITYYQGVPRRPTDPREICKTCALLALLGMWYASFIFNIADKEVIITPIPNNEVSGLKLQEIFSIQHQIRKEWFGQEIPQVLIPLFFLSRIPSSADILEGFDLFVAVLSRQQGYHVDGIYLLSIEKYLNFLRDNPFNIASIDVMLRNNAFSALTELNNVIYYKKDSITKFARLYVQETSSDKFVNLLYPQTAKYLLREVGMIRQDIIENPALASLARTLRYFIRERKYGYADDIRNARKDSRDFEETIARMLREGRLRLEQKEKIHLPTEDEIKEVFRLANENFEATKTALVILAFSFPSKVEQTAENIEEV
ncbi:type I-A CRISPR-associated protein Csa5 [Thermodesulfobacterium thermophilum]|uniref:type I-A CRISPR-associated protein Csa5 n=1 Tax=Thermodesulfobacterium thermophilum TaxID=886 RepID=UPI0003FB3B59|nr:type I-A CRISPR-associated protein Csa5 [Thermodesulfobacterium thermophilum]